MFRVFVLWSLVATVMIWVTGCGDDDSSGGSGLPALSISDVTQTEGDSGTTTFTFTVTLSSTSTSDVTVTCTSADGTATSGSDYTAISSTATIPAGSTSTTVDVMVNGDTDNEPDETFQVLLSSPVSATISDNTGLGTISNNDPGAPVLSLSFARIPGGDFSSFHADLTAIDGFGSPTSGLSVNITSAAGSVSTVTDNLDGSYRATITTGQSGEYEVTATVTDWSESVTRTSLVVKTVLDGWGQPTVVAGDVNTMGWEDGITISPDGQWLFVHYMPMTISGYLNGDMAHAWGKTCYGPWDSPKRPGFPAARITAGTGEIYHSLPLHGIDPAPFIVVPSAFYGFKRQSDGSFAEPFVIKFDDSSNGNMGPFGMSIRMTGSDTAKMVLAFNDPTTDGTNTGNDIYTVDLNLGTPTVLGEYFRNSSIPSIYATNFLPSLLIDEALDQGNPHAHYNAGGDLTHIFTDNEFVSEKDISLYTMSSGASYTAPVVLPSPVNLPGEEEIQPFFTGTELIFRRGGSIVSCAYNGGDFAQASSWSPADTLLKEDNTSDIGRVITLGEPTICRYNGKPVLFFVYGIIRSYDATATMPWFIDLNAACVEKL